MATLNGEVSIKFSKILQKITIIPRVIIKDTNHTLLPEKTVITMSFNYVKYGEQVNLYANVERNT